MPSPTVKVKVNFTNPRFSFEQYAEYESDQIDRNQRREANVMQILQDSKIGRNQDETGLQLIYTRETAHKIQS